MFEDRDHDKHSRRNINNFLVAFDTNEKFYNSLFKLLSIDEKECETKLHGIFNEAIDIVKNTHKRTKTRSTALNAALDIVHALGAYKYSDSNKMALIEKCLARYSVYLDSKSSSSSPRLKK